MQKCKKAKMKKPRIALAIGVVCISIFPVLVKLNLTPGVISAFYRMTIAAVLFLPYVIISKRFKKISGRLFFLSMLCGVLFGTDISIWNIAIQKSTATQATLLSNLTPVWVGISSLFFMRDKPTVNFWIGTFIALFGMVLLVGFKIFKNLELDLPFWFAIISGIIYAAYILISKKVLSQVDVITFITISMVSSSLYLGLVSYVINEPFWGFSNEGWWVLIIQGVVCQLLAWLLISYATQHIRATRVSLSLLGQALLASLLAWLFLDETITLQMAIGGVFMLLGIRVTFYSKQISFNLFKRNRSN